MYFRSDKVDLRSDKVDLRSDKVHLRNDKVHLRSATPSWGPPPVPSTGRQASSPVSET
jgi:hypothetical protein